MEVLIKGQVYFVEDGSYWMIGKVIVPNNGDNGGGCLRGEVTLISKEKKFHKKTTWSYYSGYRKNRLATDEEIYWLEKCIEANRFIDKEEALKGYKSNYEIY